MAKLISAAERLERARALIQQARDLPAPEGMGRYELSYIAGVKDLLRQARDMVKFIPMRAGISADMKAEVQKILDEVDEADRKIFHNSG